MASLFAAISNMAASKTLFSRERVRYTYNRTSYAWPETKRPRCCEAFQSFTVVSISLPSLISASICLTAENVNEQE